MSRIRTIKPSFFRSLSIAELDVTARLTFIGLTTYVDDQGRGVDNALLVKAEVWPLDDKHTAKKVGDDLKALEKHDHICRYEAAGGRFLHFVNWSTHQKISHPQPDTKPPCPIHECGAGDSGHGGDGGGGTPDEPGEPPDGFQSDSGTTPEGDGKDSGASLDDSGAAPEPLRLTRARVAREEVELGSGSGSGISSSSPPPLTTAAQPADDEEEDIEPHPPAKPDPPTTWELTGLIALQRLARIDLREREARRGPVISEIAWLRAAIDRRGRLHQAQLARIDLAGYIGRVDALVKLLDPTPTGGPTDRPMAGSLATIEARLRAEQRATGCQNCDDGFIEHDDGSVTICACQTETGAA